MVKTEICSDATTRPLDVVRVGLTILGRYHILDDLGEGGMGRVFKAEDRTLGESVALKFLHRKYARNATMVERFRNEVRTARRVTHPLVCRVHDIYEYAGHPFLSMEFVDGRSLHHYLETAGPLTMGRAVKIALDLCVGLEAIHSKKIIHRDLKPANVMLDRQGEVKITDFGLAGVVAELAPDTLHMGTPLYMAPEQLLGKSASMQSDLFSLGLVLYELFTGHAASEARAFTELRDLHRRGLPPPAEICPGLTAEIQEIVLACLAPKPEDRPTSINKVYLAISSHRKGPTPVMEIKMTKTPLSQPSRPGTAHKAAQPFIFGRVVWGDDFVGRKAEIKKVLDRIHTGQSTIIVGGTKSGKSSFLQKLEDELTVRVDSHLLISRIDGLTMPGDAPSFWQECLSSLSGHPDQDVVNGLKKVRDADFSTGSIKSMFRTMRHRDVRLVVLFDDFCRLILDPEFGHRKDLFALLRMLGNTTDRLPLVISSTLSMGQLNNRCRSEFGSPYFNHMIDVRMGPFDTGIVEKLLKRGGGAFSGEDRTFIRRIAGCQPYLLQAMSSILYHTEVDNHRMELAVQQFQELAFAYFDELWEWPELHDRCRTVLLIVGLSVRAGRALLKNDFEYLGKYADFGTELNRLKGMGLLIRLPEGRSTNEHCMLWRRQRWSLAMDVLLHWIENLLIKRNGNLPEFHSWLSKGRYTCILEPEEWDLLIRNALKHPDYLRGDDPDI